MSARKRVKIESSVIKKYYEAPKVPDMVEDKIGSPEDVKQSSDCSAAKEISEGITDSGQSEPENPLDNEMCDLLTFDLLPDLVIISVIKYLNLEEKKNLRLFSRRLNSRLCVLAPEFQAYTFDPAKRTPTDFILYSGKPFNIKVTNVGYSSVYKYADFIADFASRISKLTIDYDSASHLIDLLCSKKEALKFSRIKEIVVKTKSRKFEISIGLLDSCLLSLQLMSLERAILDQGFHWKFQSLTFLSLGQCHGFLAPILGNLTSSLQKLVLHDASNLKLCGMEEIGMMRKLTHLEVYNCQEEINIANLVAKCHNTIVYLELIYTATSSIPIVTEDFTRLKQIHYSVNFFDGEEDTCIIKLVDQSHRSLEVLCIHTTKVIDFKRLKRSSFNIKKLSFILPGELVKNRDDLINKCS